MTQPYTSQAKSGSTDPRERPDGVEKAIGSSGLTKPKWLEASSFKGDHGSMGCQDPKGTLALDLANLQGIVPGLNRKKRPQMSFLRGTFKRKVKEGRREPYSMLKLWSPSLWKWTFLY